MDTMDVYWEPPGSDWKMKIRDRLDFEAYFDGLRSREKSRISQDVQDSNPSTEASIQAEFLRDRTKHFWIVYHKWYNDFHGLDLEEDLGTLFMVDSDSEHEVDVPHHRQPRDALTPSVDESGDERMPAEQSSDAEQDEVDDHRMGSASPEPQVLSTSPNLRAPSLAVTPATSNTPAIPEARKRPAAASTEGGPRKRRKDSSKNVPRPNKRRDRPRAPRSKVKIARKPRDVDCNELPDHNAHHESFLYPHFRRPPPFDSKTRAVFALNSFKLVNKRVDRLISLLAIDTKDSKSALQLEGGVCTLSEEEGAEFHAGEEHPSGSPPLDEHDGARRVVIASHDILALTLSLDGTYIETRLARYLLHVPSPDYEELAAEARRLQALYLVGRQHYVLGQNRKGTQRVVDTLNEALVKTGRVPSSLEEKLHDSWRTDGLLSSLETTEVDIDIAEILYRQLPNTPYVTPFVFDLVSPFLFHGMVRTDPHHDPSLGHQRRRDDEALLQGVQDEVLDFEEGAVPEVEVPETAQGKRRIDSKSILQAGEPRTVVMVYKEALIDGELYRARDTVLVLGESPLQAAQDEPTSKDTRSSSLDDDDESVEEGDVDAAFEKELRQERASKPSALKDVTAPWFGRIVYFFYKGKDKKQLYVHIDWFHHRRATPLGQVAHARALSYADECDAIPADGIIRKIEIKRLKVDEQIPDSGFYYDNFWNKESGAYEDFEGLEDPHFVNWTLSDAAQLPRCVTCSRRLVETLTSIEDPESSKAEKDARVSVLMWVSPEESCDFIYEDILYHLGDLIYITPAYTFRFRGDVLRQPFLLAQLIAIDDVEDASTASSTPLTRVSKVRVRWLHRFDDLFNSSGATDPRRLVATTLTADVDIQNVKGKAIVLHKSELLNLATDRLPPGAKGTPEHLLSIGQALLTSDDFWCGDELAIDEKTRLQIGLSESGEPPKKRIKDSRQALRKLAKEEAPSKLPRCKVCLHERRTRLKKERQAEAIGKDDPSQRLRALSLYAGADLFGLGLEQGCRVLDVKYAVELEKDVATACQANRSRTTVYASSVSDFLEAAVQGTKVSTAASVDKTPPQRPNVDFILAGAPCQGFSLVNKYKKIDDIRCCEPWVYLGAMDHWRPAFSSFENVRAIQYYALPVGAEKGDLVNVLMDGLMRLGYQVRPDVYNAASFGTPQVRRRLILTVARRGLPLPASPKATHAYSTALTGMSKRSYDGGARQHVVKDCHRPHGHAPHPAVNFADATADLPSFGFADPYGNELPKKKSSQQQWEIAKPIGFGEDEERVYNHHLPRTAHQRAARINLRSDKLDLKSDISTTVLDHVVPPVSEKRASILAHLGVAGEGRHKGNYEDVPKFIADPDDLDTQIPLRPDFPPALRKERYDLWWRRLKWDNILTPLRTTINPDGTSHGPRIHPRDARQLSIREAARMQGFPDWIQWRDYEEDKLAAQIKMIGNAVPLPLAAALGRELFASVLTYHERTNSLKPPPVVSNATGWYSQAPTVSSFADLKGEGEAVQVSPSPTPMHEDDDDSDSDDDLVIVSQAPARHDSMVVDDEDAEEEEEDSDEELVLSLVGRR